MEIQNVSKVSPRIRGMIRSALMATAVSALFFGSIPRADASVAIYDIGAVPIPGQAGGFRATFLHAATSSRFGSVANGGRRSGALSNSLTGSMQGNLSGNILSGISGEISGMLKGLTSLFGNTSTTPFVLKLGSSAGGAGALAFETQGAGTGQFTGGFLDYELFIGTSTVVEDEGTFFFQPAAQMGGSTLDPSSPLVPNRGDSEAFTLWGNNYMQDGNSYTEQDWFDFLTDDLGYAGTTYVTRSNVDTPLGIDIYAERPSATGSGGALPEPDQSRWLSGC